MRIVVSEFAEEITSEPIRKHVLRGRGKVSYHLRIQKKWNKRHGFIRKPCAYRIGTRGGLGEALVVHPSLVAALRRANLSRSVANTLGSRYDARESKRYP